MHRRHSLAGRSSVTSCSKTAPGTLSTTRTQTELPLIHPSAKGRPSPPVQLQAQIRGGRLHGRARPYGGAWAVRRSGPPKRTFVAIGSPVRICLCRTPDGEITPTHPPAAVRLPSSHGSRVPIRGRGVSRPARCRGPCRLDGPPWRSVGQRDARESFEDDQGGGRLSNGVRDVRRRRRTPPPLHRQVQRTAPTLGARIPKPRTVRTGSASPTDKSAA